MNKNALRVTLNSTSSITPSKRVVADTTTDDTITATEDNRSLPCIANIEPKDLSDSEYDQQIGSLQTLSDDIIFENNGYKKMKKICDTLQGELFKAMKINKSECKDNADSNYVAIKKTNKVLFKQKIAIQDDVNFCVSEDISKEAMILKYLTIDNRPIGDYIVKYVEIFDSDTHYYLVLEYIASEMNLKQFVSKSHEYIENGKLSIAKYQRVIKYLLWQLFVTTGWLHDAMHCCHLDLCMENIMLINANFIEENDIISIDNKIAIKLCDFGVSEIFRMDDNKLSNQYNTDTSFLCTKYGLSIDNEAYVAPQIFNDDIYDARYADNWCLGMILFQCITNKRLYEPMDIYQPNNGYAALYSYKLREYLEINKMLTLFKGNSFSLLNGLLNVNERQRLNGMNILKHEWFKKYFNKYYQRITKKFNVETQRLMAQKHKMNCFPFYR